MLPPSAWDRLSPVTIRPARDQERSQLFDLAVLDSARPLTGEVLVAEVEGAPVAAAELGTGRTIADPFRPTADLVGLLRARAGQLR